MKITLFIVTVLLAGYYLVSQTEAGNAVLSRYLPQQQIEQTTDNLLQSVDEKIQHFAEKASNQQQQRIMQLEQRIVEMEQQLEAVEAVKQPAPEIEVAQQPVNEMDNSAVSAPERSSEPTFLPKVQPYNEFVGDRVKTNNEADVKRKKQASLQDIASRMELVSLNASRGTN